MRIAIHHRTTYRYDRPAEYAAQVLRLTPRPHAGLEVLAWNVSSNSGGTLSRFDDGYGNPSHVHTLSGVHDTVDVLVEGLVDTRETDGLVGGTTETLPLAAWLRFTSLTAPSPAIRQVAAATAARAGGRALLPQLMEEVAALVSYRKGRTGTATTAAEAAEQGHGVCQDQAHVLVSAARVLGIPARYVGGYLCLDGNSLETHERLGVDGDEEAGHAWVEAWDASRGWVGLDPANATLAGARHVRTSVGLDYDTAAPVRGVRRCRRGLQGSECMTVDVQVSRLAEQ